MALTREQKEQQAEGLRETLAEVPHAFLVDFRGLDVEGATDLRRKLREHEANFLVVKNRIALRAIGELPLNELGEAFVGQTAIAYTEGDVVGLAKTLREFAKEFETPQFKAGVVDGEPISIEEFEQLAKLSSREELVGKVLYLMQYPISGFVTVLSGLLRGFVTALDQVREHKEQAGEAEPAAEEPAEAEAVTAPAGEEAPAEDEGSDDAPEAEEASAEDEGSDGAEEASAEDEGSDGTEQAPAEDKSSDDGAEGAEAPDEVAAEETAEGPETSDEETGGDSEEETTGDEEA